MPDVPKEAEVASNDADAAGVGGDDAEDLDLSIDLESAEELPPRPPPPLPRAGVRAPPLPSWLRRSVPDHGLADLPTLGDAGKPEVVDAEKVEPRAAALEIPKSSANEIPIALASADFVEAVDIPVVPIPLASGDLEAVDVPVVPIALVSGDLEAVDIPVIPIALASGDFEAVDRKSGALGDGDESHVERRTRELAETTSDEHRAQLTYESAELAESEGDERRAVREYLAASAADPRFRESVEGLARLVGRHPKLGDLRGVTDALVDAAETPSERARASTQRALVLDEAGDSDGARMAAIEATESSAPATDVGAAWLLREFLAAKREDTVERGAALTARAELTQDPTWRGLLLVDRAKLAAKDGELEEALSILTRVASEGSRAAWIANETAERLLRKETVLEKVAVSERLAARLEERAAWIAASLEDASKGDALGVPRFVRTPIHAVYTLFQASNALQTAGDVERASRVLERAHRLLQTEQARAADDVVVSVLEHVVAQERLRLAANAGDRERAAELADAQRQTETDGPTIAELALHVAERAAGADDWAGALAALSSATTHDPASAPAHARTIDVLLRTEDHARLAEELEGLAARYDRPDARGRAFVVASYVWACRALDGARAKSALGRAAEAGVDKAILARLGRTFASLSSNDEWYEAATTNLIGTLENATEPDPTTSRRLLVLWVELARLRLARGDEAGFVRAATALRGRANGAWLGRVLESFGAFPALEAEASDEESSGDERASDTAKNHARAALDQLVREESDPKRRRSLKIVATLRDHERGEIDRAVATLRELFDEDPSDTVVAGYLGALLRNSGDEKSAAEIAMTTATAIASSHASAEDAFVGTRLLEAGFGLWKVGDRAGALTAFERASAVAPHASETVLAWASRGVPFDLELRRRALAFDDAMETGDLATALESFALEVSKGDPDEAALALAKADGTTDADVRLAAALARAAWPRGSADANALNDALTVIGTAGGNGTLAAAAERFRVERERAGTSNDENVAFAARAWLDVGGGTAAALEWLGATMAVGDDSAEATARRALATNFSGTAREQLRSSASLLSIARGHETSEPLEGTSAAVRLTHLERSRPGTDRHERARVLDTLGDALGEDARLSALGMAAWSRLASSDFEGALEAFREITRARPEELHAWEGWRTAAVHLGRSYDVAVACEELGARSASRTQGAAFLEHAALLWLELAKEDPSLEARADRAFEACLKRDPTRHVAFDKLFRRVRDRKDGDMLVALAQERLAITDDPTEIAKMYWEIARALREKGDVDGALEALEHVTLFDEDHVGALALTGEIFIRRGKFAEAAEKLAHLAGVTSAPPKNRITAGVAAVDLYENKLGRQDRALEVLLALHREKLTTLPVRERIAKAAAKTGAWIEATQILEELMLERPEKTGRIEAARLAMVLHRDRLTNPRGATTAVTKLLEEAPADGEALDLVVGLDASVPGRTALLERGRDALLTLLDRAPSDLDGLARLARIAHALGDDALERSAWGSVRGLSDAHRVAEDAFATLAANDVRVPTTSLRPPESWLDRLAGTEPVDAVSAAVAELFSILAPTLAEALGPSLATLGIHPKKDRIDARSGLSLRNELAAWLSRFGIAQFELYVGGADPEGIQAIPGETPAVVVGPDVRAPLSPVTRARIAREAMGLARGSTIARFRDDAGLIAVVAAACKSTKVPFDVPSGEGYAEIERAFGKAVSRKTKALVEPLCRKIAGHTAESSSRIQDWGRRVRAEQARAALVACGDVARVVDDVLDQPAERLPKLATNDARGQDLLRFGLSSRYFECRRLLGLEVDHG